MSYQGPGGGTIDASTPGLITSGPLKGVISNATFYFVPNGTVVPRNFNPGFVVLSFIISLVGAVTTLELLHRRTSGRGWYNGFLWIGSSVTMGAVAIWSQYYIGNHAISLCGDRLQYQIQYSPAFTALSFFVPITVLLVAFLALGAHDDVGAVRVGVAGTLAGLAICGMHYLGQAGLANYSNVYRVGSIVGSAIVAVVASIIALTIFFRLRATWTNSWWKRSLCALLLAGAISGQYWIASVGTQYRFRRTREKQNITRSQTVIIVLVLALGACGTLLMLAVLAQRRRQQAADRARQVVLACVTFDEDGRLMVTPEGTLPSQKITNTYIERSFDDIFSVAHPVFLWVFRTSRNWSGIKGLLSGMRRHLQRTGLTKVPRPSSRSWPVSNRSSGDFSEYDHQEASEDYSVIFRELFCVAAVDLAAKVNEPLSDLGVLYDELMYTGTVKQSKKRFSLTPTQSLTDVSDSESGLTIPAAFGRGQVLFVVRRANKADAARLQSHGFRFSELSNVVDVLAKNMQVEKAALATRMQGMEKYSKGDQIIEAGVHLGCFAIRAQVGGGGFDVLVRRDAKNRLPTVTLPLMSLEEPARAMLNRADGWTVERCLEWLGHDKQAHFTTPTEMAFAGQLHEALKTLAVEIGDPLFHEARLIARPSQVPCRGLNQSDEPGRATMMVFRLVLPIHGRPCNTDLVFSPLTVFKCQQRVYRNAPDHSIFARQTLREFSPLLFPRRRVDDDEADENPAATDFVPRLTRRASNRRASTRRSWLGNALTTLAERHGDSGCELPSNSGVLEKPERYRLQDVKGIMVSQEVSVDVKEVPSSPMSQNSVKFERSAMDNRGFYSKTEEDLESFVDRLFAASFEGMGGR